MSPDAIMQLWKDYIAAENVRVRQKSLASLEQFIEAVMPLPPDVWHLWARDLARRVVDEHEDIAIRLPLFQAVVFPALRAGLESSIPGSARWLAGFAQALYHSPACSDQLPKKQRSEYDLLLRALQDDRSDIGAKKHLLRLMRSHFDYALHELPSGVLYERDGATIEQCDELLNELSDYERIAEEIGSEAADRKLIATARLHIPAYQRFLTGPNRNTSYKEYLSEHEGVSGHNI